MYEKDMDKKKFIKYLLFWAKLKNKYAFSPRE